MSGERKCTTSFCNESFYANEKYYHDSYPTRADVNGNNGMFSHQTRMRERESKKME